MSVATFASSPADPPYFVSLGREGSAEPLVFFRDGHWTEFGAKSAIPVSVAIDAARQFLATGERPTMIEWTEV